MVEVDDLQHSGESASEGVEILQLQLLDRGMSSSKVDRKINAIVAHLTTPLETLIQSMRDFNESSSNHSTDENSSSERSSLSGPISKAFVFFFFGLS